MARVKLTKTELKAQTDSLRRFQRFLPMLQLKKQQLQGEIAILVAKAEAVADKLASRRAEFATWAGLLATAPELVKDAVLPGEVKTTALNVAGVTIPVFSGMEVTFREDDEWATPVWIDDYKHLAQEALIFKAEKETLLTARGLIEEELRLTSQRVNLFEKVKIPQCREAIRVIKIALGDEQTAAVTRGKIAKSRVPVDENKEAQL